MSPKGRYVVLMTSKGEDGDGSEFRHIPTREGRTFHTLCGWCDCLGAEQKLISEVGPPDCEQCLSVVRDALPYRHFA